MQYSVSVSPTTYTMMQCDDQPMMCFDAEPSNSSSVSPLGLAFWIVIVHASYTGIYKLNSVRYRHICVIRTATTTCVSTEWCLLVDCDHSLLYFTANCDYYSINPTTSYTRLFCFLIPAPSFEGWCYTCSLLFAFRAIHEKGYTLAIPYQSKSGSVIV